MGNAAARGLWIRLGALDGLMAVAAGAFAAHGVADPLAREWLRTGALYQALHAVAATACLTGARGTSRSASLIGALFSVGGLLFGASLYALAFGAPRWLGAVTPLGGLAMLGGWAILLWRGTATAETS
ncbi:MAG: DUF423 domain-containing protein [Caulobacteraceae bacterium]|nr:DUF423 domain-containing protein [Caulobacteraceae bacterium]